MPRKAHRRGGLAGTLLLAVALPAQDDSGWINLFDGTTLDGWRRINGSADFRVEDGAIVGTTALDSPNSFLCTERFYGDFDLRFEVKLFDRALNSGVQVRSHSIPTWREGRVHGYQVEIATNGNAGFVYDEGGRGWLSKERSDAAARAAFVEGEWNRYRVLCQGSRIRTWINDVPVADVKDDLSATGFVGLQVHSVDGDPKWRVAWRRLRLRELGDGGGWASLFDGADLDGWKVSENPGSVRVEDGAIVVGGPRAHAFYDGAVYRHSFKNFEFEASVRVDPGANSGIYFHTRFQESGWPSKGYEVQVNNTHGDWRKTGGLYAVQDVRESPVRDGEWFRVRIAVQDRHIQVYVNDDLTADYTEPEDVQREKALAGRLLSRGTFALQCHDPDSVVRFKDLRVRVLPE